jgi:hypothetical protein
MITILKFFENTNKQNQDDDNDVISRTMLKIAVVSRHYKQQHSATMPKHGELWRCKIVKEISSGINKGCFVVEPLEQLSEDSIVRLIPGFFCRKFVKGRLIIYPKKPGHDWILPLTHKRIMAEEHNAYCVIVQLDGSAEDLRECEKNAEIASKLDEPPVKE